MFTKKACLLFICFFCLKFECTKASVSSHPSNWSNTKLIQMLKTGDVVAMQSMRDYLQKQGKKIEFEGDVYFVALDNGLKAVFKPISDDDIGDAHAEIGAYHAATILGFPHVPPTIMRHIRSKKGILQLYVDTKMDPLVSKDYEAALKNVTPEDLANLKLFYFVFGQWDSGPHNQLILKEKDKTYLIAIDNEGIQNHQYVKYGSLPFVRVRYSDKLKTDDWDKPFPFEQVKVIRHPTPENLKKAFGNAFPERFYKSFKSYNNPLYYVIYQNSLWRQFHAEDKRFSMSHTDYLPRETKKKLKALDQPLLKKIFKDAEGSDFLTPKFLNAILDRRDQVLDYFKAKKKKA